MHSLIRRFIPLSNFSKPSGFLRKYVIAYLVRLERRAVTSTLEPRASASSIVLAGGTEAIPRMQEKPCADLLYLCCEETNTAAEFAGGGASGQIRDRTRYCGRWTGHVRLVQRTFLPASPITPCRAPRPQRVSRRYTLTTRSTQSEFHADRNRRNPLFCARHHSLDQMGPVLSARTTQGGDCAF
jgi:hypothetical protein